jgi:hypothetical protein
MSLRVMAVSGLAAAGLLLTMPAAQAVTSPLPTPAQLTGTQLASRLLPPSSFPSGYKIVKSGTYNSGGRLERGPVKHHLPAFSCKRYIVNGLPETGFGETATAGDIIGAGKQFYVQTAFQFASSRQATAFYRQLYALTARCRTVTASFQGTVRLTTQSLKKTHLGTLPAFLAKQTLSATGLFTTINDTLATVSGRDVVIIDAAGQKVPAKPALRTAVRDLVARILHFTPRVPA